MPRQDFVVPSEHPWPKQMWNKSLSNRTLQLRHRKAILSNAQIESLNSIGFIWNVNDTHWHDNILPSLKRYREIHGNLDIPRSFLVPSCDSWPQEMHGRSLGDVIIRLRTEKHGLPAHQLEALEDLGMIWNHRTYRFTSKILPAIQAYYAEHGDLNMPKGFVVPPDPIYPKTAWSMKLGAVLGGMKRKRSFYDLTVEFWDALEQMGFAYAAKTRLTLSEIEMEDIIQGLEKHKEI